MNFTAKPARLTTNSPTFALELQKKLIGSVEVQKAIRQRVEDILSDVRLRGDAAVLEYTARWDDWSPSNAPSFEISAAELSAAYQSLPKQLQTALASAAERIKRYHDLQKKACGESWQYTDGQGTILGQKVTPLARVGIYVPGGKASYPSSVLMNAIPAQVAGVPEIIMCVPSPSGVKNPMVLAAAYLSGVTRVFSIGGAQAIGALAFGTNTIPKADKITGPGNAYVAEAKRQVFGLVGVDMIAGPSEILILADGSTNPDWVAMDLFSQAEHDELAQSILLCPSSAYLDAVQASIDRLLNEMPRAAIIAASLNQRGALIQTRDMEEACSISNQIAPEHLEISSANPHQWEPLLHNAGALFLGAYTSEALGDYCAGPNHVLPTSGTARFSSPLGVYDFQKRSSLIDVSRADAQTLGAVAHTLALSEGLEAHARAAQMRLDAAT